MLRSKRKNKGVIKSFNYKDVVHYQRYNNDVLSFYDEYKNEITGSSVVDNLVDIPDATLNDKKSIKCLGFGLGGTTFICINNRWRFMLGYTTLKTDYAAAALGAPKTTKQIIRQFTIPRINGKSIMQPGDLIRIYAECFKSGGTNIGTRSFFFGNTGTTASDVEIDVVSGATASISSFTEIFEFYRMDDSGGNSIIMKNFSKGPNGTNLGGVQGSTVLPGESITIPNMDSNDTYVSFALVMNGTGDTFNNNNWNVELLTTGP